jgi:hypothetical protein
VPKDSLSAKWHHHNIPAVFFGKEEVASLGVVDEKCERIVRFEVAWDYFGNDPHPE